VTNAAVAAPAMFNAWGRQLIGGIGWELVARTPQEEERPLPNFTAMDALGGQFITQINICYFIWFF
jgi:hypothetical protein